MMILLADVLKCKVNRVRGDRVTAKKMSCSNNWLDIRMHEHFQAVLVSAETGPTVHAKQVGQTWFPKPRATFPR
jgi:hypothetical protein